ncbi:hypothetical protein Dda3937_04556 [Dickeya dadantii 3937]|uniref:Uncharacterized protein n=1 Tax=Dickeya dadantii (strain 3937) TaxID=198628 RepID=E0SM29_DICD3|nr:hypothetical protein Dda3937_04556 [Dickeya dadantii 3937]
MARSLLNSSFFFATSYGQHRRSLLTDLLPVIPAVLQLRMRWSLSLISVSYRCKRPGFSGLQLAHDLNYLG